MPVKISGASPVSKIDIDRFSTELGNKLPNTYEEFLSLHNGAKPETNVFRISNDNNCGVDRFIPVLKIRDEIKNIDHVSSAKIPIAWAEGGNYLLLDLDSGKISFWDHEIPEEQYDLAPDINTFLEQLKPFDPSTVTLKEGQVESAWIDPDFLKNL